MYKKFYLLAVLLAITTSSTYAEVKIPYPPLITKQPPSDEILFKVVESEYESDKPFKLDCEAEGDPSPTYEWIKNGKPFDITSYNNRIVQSPGRGDLIFTSPRDDDEGYYQCSAINEYGIAKSNSVSVRKSYLNSFKNEDIKTVTVTEGDSIKFECNPPDGYPKPSIHWLQITVDGTMRKINNSRMTIDPEGNLLISNVWSTDSSNSSFYIEYYFCAVTSHFQNEYILGNKIFLNVVGKLEQQYVSHEHQVALLGENIELFCIYGGESIQIYWRKNDQKINFDDRILLTNYEKSLLIRNVSYDDASNYSCNVFNFVGNKKSHSFNLEVLAKPYFEGRAVNIIIAENSYESFVMRCDVKGSPEPTIEWTYNGKPISEAPVNTRRRVFKEMISIERAQKSDMGIYSCNASNSLGYVYKNQYLIVLDKNLYESIVSNESIEAKPSQVQMLEATQNFFSEMLITWKEPQQTNGELLGYKINIEKVFGYRLVKLPGRDIYIQDPKQLSFKLENLYADTIYRIHVKPITEAGEGENFVIEKKTLPWSRKVRN